MQAQSQPSSPPQYRPSHPSIWPGDFKADEKTTNAAVAAALQAGYRHIDVRSIISTSPAIGSGLKAALDAGFAKREEVFVTSKLW